MLSARHGGLKIAVAGTAAFILRPSKGHARGAVGGVPHILSFHCESGANRQGCAAGTL